MGNKIPPEPPESTPWCSGPSQGEGACFTQCSLSTPQGTMAGTAWMCVTSTPARTSRSVVASQAHPWATCASAEGTFSGSTVSTGEMWSTGQGHGLHAWLCAALSSRLCDQGPLSATRLLGAAEQLGWWEEKAPEDLVVVTAEVYLSLGWTSSVQRAGGGAPPAGPVTVM